MADGLINQQGKMRAGVSKVKGEDGKRYYAKRRYEPGAVAALGIPASLQSTLVWVLLTSLVGQTDISCCT